MAIITSADLGNAVAGQLSGSRVRATAPASPAPTNATTVLTWATEVYDVGGWFTAGGSVFTVPSGQGGLYLMTANLQADDSAANRNVSIMIQRDPLGGGAFAMIGRQSGIGTNTESDGDNAVSDSLVVVMDLAATDLIRAVVITDNQTAAITGSFSITRLASTV